MESVAKSTSTKSLSKGEKMVAVGGGVELYLRWVRPESPKGTVLLAHGAGEHCGRYLHLERAFTDAGWSLYAYDQRGHGKSTGRRMHVDGFDDYVDDLAKVYDEVKVHAGEGRVFVYGHSMGGLIVATWAALRRPAVWGVILSAPPFQIAVPVPKAKIAAAKVLSKIVPTLALANEIDPNLLSRDSAVGRAYVMDSAVARKATVRWGAEFLRGVDRMATRAAEMEVPFLLVHGTADGIAGVEGSKAFFSKAASSDKTMKLYEGAFHEVHNELAVDRNRLFSDVLAWLDAHRG